MKYHRKRFRNDQKVLADRKAAIFEWVMIILAIMVGWPLWKALLFGV